MPYDGGTRTQPLRAASRPSRSDIALVPIRRLLDLSLVLLLALALAASGGMSASMALDDAAQAEAAATPHGQGMAMAHGGHAMGHQHHSGPEVRSRDSPPRHDRHGSMPDHCSLCLIVHAAADLPGPDLPPRAVAWHPLPWIAPTTVLAMVQRARAPPARGPPLLAA